MEKEKKKEINQLFDLQREINQKKISKNKKMSKHLQEYEEFRKKVMKQNFAVFNKKYVKCFELNFINELPLSDYSKNIILKHFKDLESSGIKIKEKFQKQISIQINEISQHGQLMQIVVTFGYLQFNLKVLNFVQENQKFNQQISQIGKGSYGCIYSYIDNEKKYAIKKIKIKDFNKGSDEIVYQTKSPLLQYCIYKLLSVVKLGLNLSQDVFGFDLLCFQDVICFSMQIGVQPRFQSSSSIESDSSKKFIQLQQTLLFLHDFHIVHSDIKPQNILYSTEHDRIVFIDFGISDFIQQCQGELTYSNYKGTFQYCSDQMKRLLINKQTQLIDMYWNDLFSLQISVGLIIKNQKLFQNFISQFEKNSKQKTREIIDRFPEQSNESNFRNFFLQAKLIFLIYQENKERIEDFLQKQKMDIANVIPIFLQLNPTIILSRIYKVLFKKKIQNLSFLNQIKNQIDQIFGSHTLKSLIKYNSIKREFFKKRYRQNNFFSNRQDLQLVMRKKLIENIDKFNSQNESLCYFQFLEWLEKINFFIINEKIIKKQTIFEIIRIFGRKLFENQSDLLSIDVLLLNCLKKIKQDTQAKIEQFFQTNRKNKNREITESQRMLNQLNTQILFKLSTVFYRINEYQLSKDVLLCYINFTFNISKFFYSIFQVMKTIFFAQNTNFPMIYIAYFQAVYPNNADIFIQKKYQQVQAYLPQFPNEKQSSFTSKILIQLKLKVALFWEKANIRERNLFEIYLQIIRIMFIPLKVQFFKFQKVKNDNIRLLDKRINGFVFRLLSNQFQIEEFYLKKLIIDINCQLAKITFYLDFQKQISIYYKLLEKKNQKYINDMMNQQLLVALAQRLFNRKLNLEQFRNIIKNVKEQNIFGKSMDFKDKCTYLKTFFLRINPQTQQQREKILLFLLQKAINRGYQVKKRGNREPNLIFKILEYYNSINNYDIRQLYYWKIKQFLIQYEIDFKKFHKIFTQLLNLIPIEEYQKQFFCKQIETQLKNAEEIDGFKQNQDAFWILKAKYFKFKKGNKKEIQIYRQSYKYSAHLHSFRSVLKYIDAIRFQIKNNKTLLKSDNKIIEQEQNYYKQIIQIINNLDKKGRQNCFLIPGTASFHCFLLSAFFKTQSYSFIINYFVKLTQFIKQLTQVLNKDYLKFYKALTTQFLNSDFFKQKDIEFSNFALELFMNSPIEQISKYFPQILFFYSALLARNRKYVMTCLQYKSMIKILKIINYTSKTTQREIQQNFYLLMVEVTEKWQIAKKHKTKIKTTQKSYYLKCMRHTQFSQYFNFEQLYMNRKFSKFHYRLINKIQTLKSIWK